MGERRGLKIDYAGGAQLVHFVLEDALLSDMHCFVCSRVQVTLDINKCACTAPPARDAGLTVTITKVSAGVDRLAAREIPCLSVVVT